MWMKKDLLSGFPWVECLSLFLFGGRKKMKLPPKNDWRGGGKFLFVFKKRFCKGETKR
jgi:hypothetical protein